MPALRTTGIGCFVVFGTKTWPFEIGKNGRGQHFFALQTTIAALQAQDQQAVGQTLRRNTFPVGVIAARAVQHDSGVAVLPFFMPGHLNRLEFLFVGVLRVVAETFKRHHPFMEIGESNG